MLVPRFSGEKMTKEIWIRIVFGIIVFLFGIIFTMKMIDNRKRYQEELKVKIVDCRNLQSKSDTCECLQVLSINNSVDTCKKLPVYGWVLPGGEEPTEPPSWRRKMVGKSLRVIGDHLLEE